MTVRTLLAASTALCATPALAVVDPPPSSPVDGRMRTIVYNRNNPVQLYAAPGASLRIELGADEKVLSIVVSDQGTIVPEEETQELASSASDRFTTPSQSGANKGPASCDANMCRTVTGNFVYLKPLRQLVPQPLFIQTERTDESGKAEMVPYTFEVLTRPGDLQASTPNTAWGVTFTYPEREKAAKLAEAQRKRAAWLAAARERAALTPPPNAAPDATANWRYGYRGDAATMPDEAWDDGRTTFLRFNGNRRVPNVYRRLPDGKESIPAYAVEPDAGGNTMRIAHTDTKWFIRDGDVAGCLFDLGPDPKGAATPAGKLGLAGAAR